MKIIICGLPGTGKTTLARSISDRYGIDYVSDYDIFASNGISIDSGMDKVDISSQYADILLQRVSSSSSIVLDAEYTISPSYYSQHKLDGVHIIYLGFASTSVEDLYRVFRESKSNAKYTDDVLLDRVSEYSRLSTLYKAECEAHDIQFVDICGNRASTLAHILTSLEDE